MSTTASPRVLGDRYEVGDLIARGGMSEVRRGHDRRLGRAVAIKLLDPHAPDEAARTRFLAEAQVLARLSHPHLVTVLDTGITDDRPWLVMELVPGPTLAAALGDGPLDPERARSVGGALARALAAVHAGGVVHRDVKPANVLLGLDGEQVRLTDFGVARLLDGTAEITRADQTVGTAPYLAPEQLRGERVDGAADVFALGLVLLECLTGRRAYPGSGVEAMLARLHHAPDVPAHLPAPLGALLREMTDLEPSRRPSAAAVADRLAAAPLPDGPAASTASDGSTRLLTAVAPVAASRSASTPASERWATIRDRVRAVPEATRALIAVGLALAVLLVVAALARGGSEAPTPAPRSPSDASTSTPGTGTGIPDGVPSRYRDPLTRLHEEVDR